MFESHIVAAALKMSSVDDNPCKSLIPEESSDLNTLDSSDLTHLNAEKNKMMLAVSKYLVKRFNL